MSITTQIAKHLREVHFGGNWTFSNYRDQLKDVTWQEASIHVHSLNSILTLVYHTSYYVAAQIRFLQGKALDAKDEHSFVHPPLTSQKAWEELLANLWNQAEHAAHLIEQLDDKKLSEDFSDAKYGSYYRNLQGMIEHHHYHLGQIALIKKIIRSSGH